jgi:hypothetical protein
MAMSVDFAAWKWIPAKADKMRCSEACQRNLGKPTPDRVSEKGYLSHAQKRDH